MFNIYQLFPRLFGNKSTNVQPNGTIESNGCGKFNDINDAALSSIKELGITHIWLTGVIRHATLTNYSEYNIPSSHPSVVKGRAGSPYAISDYYDVDPDLAESVSNRMSEFTSLINRIHSNGMKVIIDFVPNHLAREYKSVARPDHVKDFGSDDKNHLPFHKDNNFYYLPNQSFLPPRREESLYQSDKIYVEQPAKATGNDCFTAVPSLNDWFETVKLNYGIDYLDNHLTYFEPIPDTWIKMKEILLYWSEKGVDGFRADMAEMVPVAFWQWVITSVKGQYPQLVMIAEIYQPGLYESYLKAGFDFLYDKVCLYNRLHDVLIHGHAAESISSCWKMMEGYNHRMLRFMENHDEPRLASPRFFGDAFAALPTIALSAFMHSSAYMIYNGQECGENALGTMGFSGDDGRTSIFDYCHMPEHQRWMNGGAFNGGNLSYDQRNLRAAYKKILQERLKQPALLKGKFYDLMWANPWYTEFDPRNVFVFLRFSEEQNLLIVINFNRLESRTVRINMHNDAMELMKIDSSSEELYEAIDLFSESTPIFFRPNELPDKGIRVALRSSQYAVFELKKVLDNN
ncbi:MAG: alpha amylase catalytic region [Bacteroidetes bacterium]|nr:MAG: alpha amylase catalytic region [Bacteroidota bacterium]